MCVNGMRGGLVRGVGGWAAAIRLRWAVDLSGCGRAFRCFCANSKHAFLTRLEKVKLCAVYRLRRFLIPGVAIRNWAFWMAGLAADSCACARDTISNLKFEISDGNENPEAMSLLVAGILVRDGRGSDRPARSGALAVSSGLFPRSRWLGAPVMISVSLATSFATSSS